MMLNDRDEIGLKWRTQEHWLVLTEGIIDGKNGRCKSNEMGYVHKEAVRR